jgi:Immunoglobulin-like domain of bacterial spore germination/Sporulation and spore germination
MRVVTSRPTLLAIVVVALLASGVTACGGDDEVVESEVAIYLVRGGKVSPVRRVVRVSPELDPIYATLMSLFQGPTAFEREAGYTTAIPGGVPDGLMLASGVAETGFGDTDAPSRLAVAQVVYTLTQFDEVERVAVEGSPIAERPTTRKAFEAVTPQILVESPLPGDVVSSPILLRGTANVFEANVSIEVRDESGSVVLETFTTATSGTGTRGTFATELELPESGTMTIVAFEASARDGTPLHVVEVPVTVES